MAQYLNKFKSSISKNQFEKLTRLLDAQKRRGQFSTIDEFRKHLDSVMKELFTKRITPLLEVFLAIPGEVADVETYNFMLERIQDDLEVAFKEIANIEEVLRGHRAVVQDVLLKGLKHAAADLENKISTYELMVTSGHGFNSALASNFDGAISPRLKRAEDVGGYFKDPRTGRAISADYDIYLDQMGKFLTLPVQSSSYVNIVGVRQIFDSDATATEKNVEPEDSSVSNLIDGENGTYWMVLSLFEDNKNDKFPAEVKTRIELDLGGAKEVNFLEIEPALLNDVTLDSMSYIRKDGSVETVAGVSETIGRHRVKILFRKIGAKKIILTFSNETSHALAYEVPDTEVTLEELLTEPVNEKISQMQVSLTESFSGRQFQIGFDNIRVGLAKYLDKGVFINKALELKSKPARSFGLQVEEERPANSTALPSGISFTEDTYDDGDTKFMYGSIEYWLIRNSYDSNERFIASDFLPILPLEVSRVNHERLILTHKYGATSVVNDSGTTMFYTDATNGNIKVYRNGELTPLTQLTPGDTADGWVEESNLVNTSSGNGTPMSYGIRITQPKAGDIFTVSYDPIVSNVLTISTASGATQQNLVDLLGDLSARSYTDQILLSSDHKGAFEIESSKVYLMTILRRNTSDEFLSPLVKEHLLGVSTKNPSKFQGF